MSDCAAEVSGGFSGKMRSLGDTPRGSGSEQEGPRVEDVRQRLRLSHLPGASRSFVGISIQFGAQECWSGCGIYTETHGMTYKGRASSPFEYTNRSLMTALIGLHNALYFYKKIQIM